MASFRLLILLLETLSLMLRETEVVHTRLHCLTASRGKAAVDLITTLTCMPELPDKYIPGSSTVYQQSPQTDQRRAELHLDVSNMVQNVCHILWL